MIGLRGFRELDSRALANVSLLGEALNKKREGEAEAVVFAVRSVKTSEAPLTIGYNRSTILPISPVY